MDRAAILQTLAELDRWRQRRVELLEEMARVNQQVTYYERLSAQMKRQVKPARVSDLIASMVKL